jgi:hypothetical protein
MEAKPESSDRLPKHLLIGFGLALLVYASFFSCDQYVRHRKGPWEVTFSTNSTGWAQIEISHPGSRIHSIIIFEGEKATNSGSVNFEQPEKAIPFGKMKFEDLTYLPGSVVFDLFGHEVELLPRTLYLNKKEHPWVRDEVIMLKADEKLPPEMSYDPRKKKRRL